MKESRTIGEKTKRGYITNIKSTREKGKLLIFYRIGGTWISEEELEKEEEI